MRHEFEFVQTSAKTGYQIERLLRRYGILVYGRFADGKRIRMQVAQQQAVWAEYLLLAAGIEPVSPPVDRANWQRARRPLPRAWGVAPRRDWLSLWVDWLGALLGAPR
jgi:hypothetical protein